MRVKAGSLDLESLGVGRPCVIITSDAGVRICPQGGHEILMGVSLGEAPGAHSITTERRGDRWTYWLNLAAALQPRKVYRLTVLALRDGCPSVELRDLTPAHFEDEPEFEVSGWAAIRRRLGGWRS